MAERDEVRCPCCGYKIFDGLLIKSRLVRLLPSGGAEAKCKQCKSWVPVPATYEREVAG